MARAVAILIALSAGALLVACGTDASKSATTTTEQLTTTSATTTTQDTTPDPTPTTSTFPPGSTEAQVAEAYVRAVSTGYERLQNPNPDDPAIAAHHTGASLDRVVSSNRSLLSEGRAVRLPSGPPEVIVQGVELTGSREATVIGCYVDDSVIYWVATNETIDDDVSTWIMRAHMVLEEGTWKLESNGVASNSPGATDCEASS